MKSKASVAIAATAVVMAMSLTPGAAFAADETTEPTTAVTAPAAEDQTPVSAPAEDGTSGNPGAPVDEGTGTDGPQRGDAGAPTEGTGGTTTPTSPTEGTGTPTEGTGNGTTTPTAPTEGTGTTPTSPTEGTSTTPTEGTGTGTTPTAPTEGTGTTPTAPTEGTGTTTPTAPTEGTGGGKGDAGAPTSPNGPQPVTSMESAYVALAGANAYYGAGPCVKFGSGSTTPGSTLALPSIREGAFLGWKITAENASTWALDWYACDAAGPAYDPNAGGGNGGTNPGDGGNTGGGAVDPGTTPGGDGGSAPVDGGNAGTTVGTDAANALISTADSGSTDAGAVSAENASYERDAAEGTLAYTGGNTDGVGFIATIGALFAMLGALALRIQRRARNNA